MKKYLRERKNRMNKMNYQKNIKCLYFSFFLNYSDLDYLMRCVERFFDPGFLEYCVMLCDSML